MSRTLGGRLFFRLNAKFRERRYRFFHRQTDHIRVGAGDLLDDFCALALGGVGAGFVERIDLLDISANGCVAQFLETDMRDFLKTCRSCPGQPANKNRSANFVSASAQPSQNRSRFVETVRFADYATV